MRNRRIVVGVIPARYASKRLPFKLLRSIEGKPLLRWTWEKASCARALDKLIIACDHPELESAAKTFGADVIITSLRHESGTDRIAEAVKDVNADIIINIQADEPLLNPLIIDSLADEMLGDPGLVMATVKKKINEKNQADNPNVVKVICDKNNFAVYFSRFPIPYFRDDGVSCGCQKAEKVYYKHLGIYAYTKEFLYVFKDLPFSYLEKAEKLEQLRALEAGYKIKVIETDFDSQGVDTEEDLRRVESILSGNE